MLGDERSRSWEFFIRAIPIIPFFLFLISFTKEITTTASYLWGLYLQRLGGPAQLLTPEINRSILVVTYNLIFGFSLFFLIWLFLTASQALLPVSSLDEKIQTAFQLILFILFLHGPAVFVKDGKLRTDAKKLRRVGPGVAVIDFNSAMVLEQIVWPPIWLASIFGILTDLSKFILRLLGARHQEPNPARVCGPGLTFIDIGERIQGTGDLKETSGPVENISGVVDLRRQFRSSGQTPAGHPERIRTSVHAYTRDGIKLETSLSTLFTIGQQMNTAPNVLDVAYDGEQSPENLRVVSLEDRNGSVLIRSITKELDSDDCAEIHEYATSRMRTWRYQEKLLTRGPREPVFDPNRVFSAVYARARLQPETEHVLPWTELPNRMAIDFFREALSQVNFDDLYREDQSGRLKIDILRRELQIRMRNSGMLSYRLIFHRNSWPLTPNQTYDYRDLLVSDVQIMQTQKLLRERGIQALISGFGDLLPDEEIYLQWLASWRAEWEQETMTAHAIGDLEARRVYSRARAQAQQAMALNLREIFQGERNSREAIAIRILQALETIAADRDTRRLLPADTISMLGNIHSLLLPDDGAGVFQEAPLPPISRS